MYVVICVKMLLDYYVCLTPPLLIKMPVPSKE